MNVNAELLNDVTIPEMVQIRQKFDDDHIALSDLKGVIFTQLFRQEIKSKIQPGMEIAITAGSRGIANIPLILKIIADFVKEQKATPFIIPAMGSHGGATAEGQRAVLESYGITEAFTGCEIRSSMETEQIGKTESGKEVRIDKNAVHSDGIIVCGRIKPHTGFRGNYESGLMKMMAIGMGKQFGAEIIHSDGFGHMRENIPMFGKCILKNVPVICGVGILENAYDQTREIHILTPEEIITEEPKLLQRAKEYMPRILFEECDVLVVDKMGKNISGDGMDPNISGRFPTPFAKGGIKAQRVVVLDLTEETHGNACGIGLADITTKRLVKKMDFEQTYPNALTNTIVEEMKIPMAMESDKLAIQAAIKTCIGIDKKNPRIVHIHTTLNMGQIEISRAMLEEAEIEKNIEVIGKCEEMQFDNFGNLF